MGEAGFLVDSFWWWVLGGTAGGGRRSGRDGLGALGRRLSSSRPGFAGKRTVKIRRVVRLLVVLLAAGSIHTGAFKPDPCAAVEPIAAGDSATDAVADVAAAHIDITDVETSLSGESLTVVFHLRDLPNFLTFNRAWVPPGAMEYFWRVAVDVDNDRGTGRGGFDTLLSAYHVVGASERLRTRWPRSGRSCRPTPGEETVPAIAVEGGPMLKCQPRVTQSLSTPSYPASPRNRGYRSRPWIFLTMRHPTT